MREFLLILLVILGLFALTAYRYRRQLLMGLQIWRALRGAQKKARSSSSSSVGQGGRSGDIGQGPLVSCKKCGTWTPESTAIKFGTSIHYCSAECLQTNARV